MLVAAWIFLSSVGLLFSLASAVSSYNRWQLAKVAAPEDERLVDLARSKTMAQASHLLLFLLFLAIGILSVTPYSWMFATLMFAVNIVLVVSAIREHRFLRRMYLD